MRRPNADGDTGFPADPSPESQAARARVLARIREACRVRGEIEHPGSLPASAEPPVAYAGSGRSDPVDAFDDRFRAAGGEVVRFEDERGAHAWLTRFGEGFESVAPCIGIPDLLRPGLPVAGSENAALGVSMALAAAAQTGSLVLSSREGRREQLLPPVQLVWVRVEDVYATLGEALSASRGRGGGLPATLALHSGPSKSADIGQILIRGVHGPGRIVAGLLGTALRRP